MTGFLNSFVFRMIVNNETGKMLLVSVLTLFSYFLLVNYKSGEPEDGKRGMEERGREGEGREGEGREGGYMLTYQSVHIS